MHLYKYLWVGGRGKKREGRDLRRPGRPESSQVEPGLLITLSSCCLFQQSKVNNSEQRQRIPGRPTSMRPVAPSQDFESKTVGEGRWRWKFNPIIYDASMALHYTPYSEPRSLSDSNLAIKYALGRCLLWANYLTLAWSRSAVFPFPLLLVFNFYVSLFGLLAPKAKPRRERKKKTELSHSEL